MVKPNGVKEYILRLLERQDRSVGEIRRKAKEHDFAEDEVSEAIEYLQKIKIIDDKRYAESLTRTYLNVRMAGKRYIENKLRQHLLPAEVIKEVISNIEPETELEQAKQAVEKWLKKNVGRSYNQDKLFRYLIGKGFDYDTIKRISTNKRDNF